MTHDHQLPRGDRDEAPQWKPRHLFNERPSEAIVRHAAEIHPSVAQRLREMLAEAQREAEQPKVDERVKNAQRARTELSHEERMEMLFGGPADPHFDLARMGLPVVETEHDRKGRREQRTGQRLAQLEAAVDELRRWRIEHEQECGHSAAQED